MKLTTFSIETPLLISSTLYLLSTVFTISTDTKLQSMLLTILLTTFISSFFISSSVTINALEPFDKLNLKWGKESR